MWFLPTEPLQFYLTRLTNYSCTRPGKHGIFIYHIPFFSNVIGSLLPGQGLDRLSTPSNLQVTRTLVLAYKTIDNLKLFSVHYLLPGGNKGIPSAFNNASTLSARDSLSLTSSFVSLLYTSFVFIL